MPKAKNNATFLTLPVEIRLRVYELVVQVWHASVLRDLQVCPKARFRDTGTSEDD
jgi:hypothetical protein